MSELQDIFGAEAWSGAGYVLLKLVMGILLGGAIGWERERGGHPAGIRTHMLVVLGVVLFGESSRFFSPDGDPTRIAAQIVTGVGFLGAGAILRVGPEVRGLTTAASIWASAAIGMAVSVGGSFLLVAMVGTGLALGTLAVVSRLEESLLRSKQRGSIKLRLENRDALVKVLGAFEELVEGTILAVRIASTEPDVVVEIDFHGYGRNVLEKMLGLHEVREAGL
jgi:putative Mg2+ transporter-C (MgtC) family protein